MRPVSFLSFTKRRRRTAVRALCLALVAIVGLTAWPLWLHLTGNFHTVVPGELYRSAQPAPDDLRRWTADYGIRSVLNLRGAHDGAEWYQQESAVTGELGVVLADFAMSAQKDPGPERTAQLVALMRSLPKPLLIHCQGGADRTGLASALYLAAITHLDEGASESQLSYAYGHIGVPVLSSAWAMNEAWESDEVWLGFPDS